MAEIYKKNDDMYKLIDTVKSISKEIVIKKTVTYETLEDIIVDALEGGIDYWGGIDNSLPEWDEKPADMPVSQYVFQLLVTGYSIKFFDIAHEEDDTDWKLTMDKLLKGIQLNAENRPFDCDLDNYDATTADCIIQYALFGDIIYG